MKSYTITVNGNVYDVTVEETGASSSAPVARKAAPAPKAAPAAPKASAGAGSIKVSAPMPGTVKAINVSVGDAVKKGDTILVFEAMKMENQLVAPQDGTVASIDVAVNDSFEAGVSIATLN
jgi:biotin carboxyl carrier protein